MAVPTAHERARKRGVGTVNSVRIRRDCSAKMPRLYLLSLRSVPHRDTGGIKDISHERRCERQGSVCAMRWHRQAPVNTSDAQAPAAKITLEIVSGIECSARPEDANAGAIEASIVIGLRSLLHRCGIIIANCGMVPGGLAPMTTASRAPNRSCRDVQGRTSRTAVAKPRSTPGLRRTARAYHYAVLRHRRAVTGGVGNDISVKHLPVAWRALKLVAVLETMAAGRPRSKAPARSLPMPHRFAGRKEKRNKPVPPASQDRPGPNF